MDFFKAFDKIKDALDGTDVSEVGCHLAIQINIEDPDASGICYIEVREGELFVQPYNYYDNDAVFTAALKDIVSLASGKLTYERAVESGALTVSGNLEKAALVKRFKSFVRQKGSLKSPSEPSPTPEKKSSGSSRAATVSKKHCRKKSAGE